MDLQQQQQRRVQQQILLQPQQLLPHQPPPQQAGPAQGQAPQADGDQVQINHQSLQLLLQMATNNAATQQAASNRDLLEQNAKLLELLMPPHPSTQTWRFSEICFEILNSNLN